jgi:GH25 family lysozyme M1 (1,4-beta-N-acetylmuramidase)
MAIVNNGNIILLDPNDVNTNPSMVNSIPQYQDMFIYAELRAVRKGRTVLETSSEQGNGGNILKTGMEDFTEVNFLGTDQNKTSPNYNSFTTRYYDGSNGNNIQYEGFGMSNIKVIINSSFIPQVSIQFIDVRGLAFFNRTNSPYRILFDFPPPIFYLTIKGYYGKSLKYKLHLVKYTSEFKAENGNFIIDAQFVAVTYAPLTDILFRYVVNFPLISPTNTGISLNANPNTRPENTYALILKLKNLYDEISKELKSLPQTQKYDTTLNQLAKNASTQAVIGDYNSKLAENGNSYLLMVDVAPSDNKQHEFSLNDLVYNSSNQQVPIAEKNVITITTFNDYNAYIKSLAIPAQSLDVSKRLYVVYATGKIDQIPYTGVEDKSTIAKLYMDGYKNELLNSYKETGVANSNIGIDSVKFSNQYDVTTFSNNKPSTIYTGIDITNLYVKLYKEKDSLTKSKATLSNTINGIINNMIMKNLGMMPTIYNIFEILLNDVDTFFQKVRDVSAEAERHHNNPDFNKTILGTAPNQYVDINSQATSNHIYSFPLVIDKQNVTGGQREVRVAPTNLSKLLPKPFPELTLISDFIDTFNKQKEFSEIMNAKNQMNDDGTYKWIPVSPLDSKLGSDDTKSAYTGPYYGVDTTDGGTAMPINVSNDNRLQQVIKIMLDRFYILSQSSYPSSFYDTDKKISKAYVEFFAKSEAANLANSMTETKYASNIKDNANKFTNSVDSFYTFLNTPAMKDHYAFTPIERESFPLAGDDLQGTVAYTNKNNSNYQGSIVKDEKIELQTFSDDKSSTKPVDKFQNGVLRGLFGNIFLGREHQSFYNFTNENLLYVADQYSKDGKIDTDKVITDNQGVNINTRFLDSNAFGTGYSSLNPYGQSTEDMKIQPSTKYIAPLLASGNTYFYQIGGYVKSDAASLRNFDNIINPWISQLSEHDDQIYNTIISGTNPLYNQKLSALMFLSNYGYTLSPFNQYPNRLNPLLFTIAGVLETPKYLPAYIGALLTAIEGSDTTFTTQTITDFFTTGEGKVLDSLGLFIFADIHDINHYLSANDKAIYKAQFDTFMSQQYTSILSGVQGLYSDVKDRLINQKIVKFLSYKYYLDPKSTENGSGFRYYEILSPMITRTNIVNYSESTFSTGATKVGYTSLQTLNANTGNTKIKTINDSFFKIFFAELLANINTKQDDLKKEEVAQQKLKGDEDIITQTYYSFKNINDKWLTNPDGANTKGYPSNENNKRLIDSFAFVDRAMNPIGNTILNCEILSQMLEDPNISIFSVISQLLSLNGFEFFPLQNFMSYTQQNWIESFKISTDVHSTPQPAFVCMYIGGSSSYPTGVANGFTDDGITDLGGSQATIDFKTKPPTIDINSEDGKQETKNMGFPWRQVRAFRVRFGEQNQSMFNDIKIDSKEYPETNESIQILARLAGDNKIQSPVPKGQNLYSLYENRAYRATITGLGNAMIQPTQYFQLENVPLFSGAYIILTVEHNIEPNKMTTNFSGTKILRYPVPRVLNAAAILGYDGGDSDQTNPYTQGAGEATKALAQSISQARLDAFNSVYGVDVSYAQGNFNWNLAVNSSKMNTDPSNNNPKIEFALMKTSQGTFKDSQVVANSIGAKAAGLKIGYYHYAEQYRGASVNADIIADATKQANFFVSTVNNLPNKPDFPLILDIEDDDERNKKWSLIKPNNNLWINTFISVVKAAKYNMILYSGKPWLDDHTTGNFNNITLWHAQYPYTPEVTPPSIATAWAKPNSDPKKGNEGWTVWQFSPQGKVKGNQNSKNEIDLNMMKRDFFNSPNKA